MREKDFSFQAFKKDKDRQAEILGQFTPEQQQEVKYRQQVLSSLGSFIGSDFRIPVELNEPGAGWHWDFQENKIRIDPKDLAEKPMDYLRFAVSHEGGHRRVSRTDGIPMDLWQEPGFSFLSNAIEDPRTNNFVAEAYPKFREQMGMAYEEHLGFEVHAEDKAKEKLGYQPRFMQAGFEYIKQWHKEAQGGPKGELSEDLPDDVREVVQKTLDAARQSWLHYPSRDEADRSEDLIHKYAQKSYEINKDKIWPEFKKLVEKDMEDQKMQEMMKEMSNEARSSGGQQQKQQGQQNGEGQGQGGNGLPQDLKDKLSDEEQKELSDALDKAKQEQQEQQQSGEGQQAGTSADSSGEPKQNQKQSGQRGKPIDLDSLSDELKQKIKDYMDSLPNEKKKELAEKAQKSLTEAEKEISEEMDCELSHSHNERSEAEKQSKEKQKAKHQEDEDGTPESNWNPTELREETQDMQDFKDKLEAVFNKDENAYERARQEVLPIIDELENDLREIFVQRRANKWETGFRSGKRIDIKRRMQEKVKGITPVESKAWQKRELPQEKDYAVTLLADLSGSMQGQKIRETFKGAVVLAEVLNRLSINTEVLGFNDRIHEYQPFGQPMSADVRDHMGGMLQEVNTERAGWNDDGWAVTQASERLARQKAAEKFLIVLSDGQPAESPRHSSSKYELGSVVERVGRETDQKLIGLGIGNGTNHVERYYPNSIADINVKQMAGSLAGVIREAIAYYDQF